jgi:hypothetical protein
MKSLHPRLLPAALLVVSPLLLASCARMQSWLPSFDAAAPPNAEIAVPPPELALSQSERRSQLREAARAYVDETESDEGELVKKSPYWLKEYVQYPNGTAGMRLSVRETESRTAPLIGDVQLDKQRLATRLYRDKDNAAQDTSYLRQTGTEVVTFARRHG